MSPNRLWTTIATAIVLSAVGSPGVWAEPQANCSAGWEWVGSESITPHPRPSQRRALMVFLCFRLRSYVVHALQNRNSLGQDSCFVATVLDGACRQSECLGHTTRQKLPLLTWGVRTFRFLRSI